MAKYKPTGCARFLFFLIIIAPIAYFGSKYMIDNKIIDGLKDKFEQTTVDSPLDQDIAPNKNESKDEAVLRLERRLEKIIEAYREQETIIKNQEKTINQQQDEIDRLKSTSTATTNPTQPTRTSNTNPSSTGSVSLDELLREADASMGKTTKSSTSKTSSAVRSTLGKWRYSFANVDGEIEFYQDRGRIYSLITVDGSSKTQIDELRKSGNRFDVVDSPMGEYYLLKTNGDLDAYDRNGYQTTCRRVR